MDEWKPWERLERWTALAYAGLTLVVGGLAALAVGDDSRPLALAAAGAAAAAMYHVGMRRVRRRRAILGREFPREWEAVLQRDVAFFRALETEDDRRRFRRHVQLFIGEKQITGIGIDLDATTRVLAAASAVIPIFGFPGWEWHQINEVLVYPSRFAHDFSVGNSPDHRTLGMVGTGAMSRLMILSQPDLLAGFRNPGDKRNVGLHEFAHLVDLADGAIDGTPLVGLDQGTVEPWLALVRRKMAEIEAGRSDIHPYALTNEAEFFAVATEYFFERPGVMKQKHPVLYDAMERIFQQDLRSRIASIRRELAPRKRRFGRNSRCPCGSGLKFKKCCLRRGQRTATA